MKHETYTKSSAQILLTLIASLACAETPTSENVSTQGMSADISVDVFAPEAASVKVALSIGALEDPQSPRITLGRGDELRVYIGEGSAPLSPSQNRLDGSIDYVISLANALAGEQVRVALMRRDGVSAPASSVMVPEDLEWITPSIEEQQLELSADQPSLNFVWQAGSEGDPLEFRAQLNCNDPSGSNYFVRTALTDNGQYVWLLNDLIDRLQITGERSCIVDAFLIRTRMGQLDPGYLSGGQIYARQIRQRRFQLNVQMEEEGN